MERTFSAEADPEALRSRLRELAVSLARVLGEEGGAQRGPGVQTKGGRSICTAWSYSESKVLFSFVSCFAKRTAAWPHVFCRRSRRSASTLHLKLKFADFRVITRQSSAGGPFDCA